MNYNEDIKIEDLEKGSKTFSVMFWITEGGRIVIKAQSKEEAEKKLTDYLAMYGVDEALDIRFDISHREWEVLKAETEEIGI